MVKETLVIEPEAVVAKIKESLTDAEVDIEDLTGTKDHYQAKIVAEAFRDKSRIEQHRMVYGALGELMQEAIHALALETRADDEAQQDVGNGHEHDDDQACQRAAKADRPAIQRRDERQGVDEKDVGDRSDVPGIGQQKPHPRSYTCCLVGVGPDQSGDGAAHAPDEGDKSGRDNKA